MGFGRPGGIEHIQRNQSFALATRLFPAIENIGKNSSLANLFRHAGGMA
jgi:hypothetical protein